MRSIKSRRVVNSVAPDILPVQADAPRPFWSVMIPTFNCARYLRVTLESVLREGYPPEAMQIEVVDDCSDHDDPEAVVQEVGQGRVAFFKHSRNVGHVVNFNTCLRRSKGHAVHILHGDDYVRPGFYRRMEEVLRSNPNVGAAFCRNIVSDENGYQTGISPLVRDEAGIWVNGAVELSCIQCIQTPSIVLRRSMYERLGGFDPRLSWTEDWEMWVRVAAHYPIWYEPEPLAVYRIREGSNSSRLILTAENIRDVRRCIDTFKDYFPRDKQSEIVAKARQECAQTAIGYARGLFIHGKQKAAFMQLFEAVKSSLRLRIIRGVARAVIVGQMRVISFRIFRQMFPRVS
jgi:glycosyltransferase involved in cell wall biosynthesis